MTTLRRTRALAAVTAIAATTAVFAVTAPTARADDSATLPVVGTSDVFDSNLIQTVIKPGFEKANPKYTLNYVSKGTGAAIQFAEAGTASALIVHAASLENQFVQQGYSLEQYGRAIFYGDYVLLGPKSDPAGVATGAPHDIVKAYELVAAAGAAGKANFVSRGGTPGTTVQEHAIWKLATGTTTCTVSAANGGGVSPSTAGGACPSAIAYPSWYHATGQTQAPNIQTGDVCNFPGGGCYVFTDRGTFNYLQSTNAISSLQVLTRAQGGDTLLTNSFHAYGINPAKFPASVAAQINTTAATAFLNWVTSPAAQKAVGAYLSAGGDPPFLPDAAPTLTAKGLPLSVQSGKGLTITGSVRNKVQGTPPLAGIPVTLNLLKVSTASKNKKAVAVPVARALTNGGGNFTLRYKPTASGTYSISTGSLSQIEDATLAPVFGDLLAPSELTVRKTFVVGKVTIGSVKLAGSVATLGGTITPAPDGAVGDVKVYAAGPNKPLKLLAVKQINKGRGAYSVPVTLAPGIWKVRVDYVSAGQFLPVRSAVKTVVVP